MFKKRIIPFLILVSIMATGAVYGPMVISKILAKVSIVNSSVATLGGGITFNGALEDALNYGSISVAVSTDVASAMDGLVISQGVDGVNFPFTDEYSVAAGANKPFLVNRVARYVKVDYTNGAAPQGSFFLSTILNPFHVPGSSHKIKDDILNDDDAPVHIAVLKVQTNDENTYKNVDVQNPLPSDGDSVYAKDLDLDNSDIGTFTGDIETLFNDYHTEITDTSATNPKTFTLHFRRPLTTSSIGMGSLTSDFSNVKLLLKDLAGTIRLTVDDSADSTKHTANIYQFTPITFIEVVVEFHTADAVKISGAFIPKDVPVVARMQAIKPDGTVTNIGATKSDNLKVADAEDAFNIAQGNVVGQSTIHKFGRGADIDTGDGFVALWDGAEYAAALKTYTFSTSADIDRISSDSVADTEPIEITGLDTNWDVVTQTKTLTGQTPVALDTSLIRVYRMVNVGTSDLAGSVFCFVNVATTLGVPDTITNTRAMINNGNNQTLMAIYPVPSGKTAYIINWYGALSSAKASSFNNLQMKARPFGQVFQLKHTSTLSSAGSSHIQHMFNVPQAFPAKTDFMMLSDSSVNDNAVSAGFDMILVDN